MGEYHQRVLIEKLPRDFCTLVEAFCVPGEVIL
jgi:hypothetical protein